MEERVSKEKKDGGGGREGMRTSRLSSDENHHVKFFHVVEKLAAPITAKITTYMNIFIASQSGGKSEGKGRRNFVEERDNDLFAQRASHALQFELKIKT